MTDVDWATYCQVEGRARRAEAALRAIKAVLDYECECVSRDRSDVNLNRMIEFLDEAIALADKEAT